MKTLLPALGLSAILPWFSFAQNSRPAETIAPGVSDNAAQGTTGANQSTYYSTVNQRVIELKAQFELLSLLAQEHKRRAQETSGEQAGRIQWENGLSGELSDRAAAILPRLNNLTQERIAFEQAHPNLASAARGTNGHNADEVAFLEKVDERLAAVQQEIADTLEAGKLYTAQLLTNKNSYDVAKISFYIQANGDEVKRLRKEAFDLELKKLEFRALRKD